MIVTSLSAPVDGAAFEQRTGWALKPEGACKGDACVPLPSLDAATVAERLGMPVVGDEERGLWALGPSVGVAGGRALATAELPDVVLPSVVTGEPFALRSLRGQKVLLVAWASW